jgi:hypothetical protein
MTKAEKKLLVELLKRYEDVLGNAGCNDFDLVRDGGLTDDEWPNVAIKVNALRRKECQANILGTYSVADFEVCAYLRHVLESGE